MKMRRNQQCERCNKEMKQVYHTKRYCEDCLLVLNKESMKKAQLKRIGTRHDYYAKKYEENREQIRLEHHKKYHKKLLCPNCNNSFMQDSTAQKYCSPKCMRKHHRILNKERYQILSKLRYERYKEENPNYNKENYKKYVEKENEIRKSLNLPLVGQKFLREMQMFAYLNHLFGNEEIIFHGRKELNGLELDAFIPSLKLAFEYMGRQHFEGFYNKSIFVLTQEEFLALKFRDEKKVQLCKEKGITLIHINYNEKLSEQLILKKLNEQGIECAQQKIK